MPTVLGAAATIVGTDSATAGAAATTASTDSATSGTDSTTAGTDSATAGAKQPIWAQLQLMVRPQLLLQLQVQL